MAFKYFECCRYGNVVFVVGIFRIFATAAISTISCAFSLEKRHINFGFCTQWDNHSTMYDYRWPFSFVFQGFGQKVNLLITFVVYVSYPNSISSNFPIRHSEFMFDSDDNVNFNVVVSISTWISSYIKKVCFTFTRLSLSHVTFFSCSSFSCEIIQRSGWDVVCCCKLSFRNVFIDESKAEKARKYGRQ